MTTALGIDIGGTKVSAAYIIGEQIVSTARRDYNRETIVEQIKELRDELVPENRPIARVGISCAGLVDVATAVVKFAGNLEMDNFALGQEVSAALGVPVTLDNDARCATWGEFLSAKGELGENVAGLILGTGVGGGLILNSRLLQGKNSFAGEIGHLPVSNSLKLCACGLRDCLESVAGGRAFEEDFFASHGEALTAVEISSLADGGDPRALAAFERVGTAVGEVIAQLDTALDLDAVMIGGGFGQSFRHWEQAAQTRYLERTVGASRRRPVRILAARTGNSAQLLGAVLGR